MTPPPPTTGLGRPRPGADNANQLHLDPAIEAQIRAIQAMQTQLAPEQVKEQLVNLTLPELPTELLTAADPAPAPRVAPTAPTGPHRTRTRHRIDGAASGYRR